MSSGGSYIPPAAAGPAPRAVRRVWKGAFGFSPGPGAFTDPAFDIPIVGTGRYGFEVEFDHQNNAGTGVDGLAIQILFTGTSDFISSYFHVIGLNRFSTVAVQPLATPVDHTRYQIGGIANIGSDSPRSIATVYGQLNVLTPGTFQVAWGAVTASGFQTILFPASYAEVTKLDDVGVL